MTTGALMGYPQTSSAVVGNTNGGFVYDGRFGNFYGMDIVDVPDGIRKWDAWPQGLERRARSIADLGVSGIDFVNTITYDSQELIVKNSGTLLGFNLADLTHSSTFGGDDSGLSVSGPLLILPSGQACSFLDAYGRDIVVSKTLISGATLGGCELNCINWGNKVNQKSNITENFAVIGAIPDGSGRSAWALGFGTLPINGTMTLYHIGPTFGGVGVTGAVGTLTPAQIDATWTNVTSIFGITVDQTDGHLILGFSTTDAVTNRGRLVKLNSITGAVIWSTAVAGNPGGINYDTMDMSKNVIKNGQLFYIGTAVNTLFSINTITGAATSQTLANAALDVLHGHQMSEDLTGSVMWYGGWTENTTHPAYLGNYCLTLGNHSGSSMGWRFWLAGAPSPAPVYAPPAASRKRAWSYVMDGHTFYVLDLGQQGTFIYDTTSNEWAQFITKGYIAWNFANGCMWGQRIVAGDLITTDVWEMQPGALFDNGATEIVHVVTGGVVTRNRTFHSVDAFVLACSVGQLYDTTGAATANLSFSDDQGQTWTVMDPLTLIEGDFSNEIAWRSLGSFSAPGRIFQITDSGGFLRINGADAGIDGFDAATADPGG